MKNEKFNLMFMQLYNAYGKYATIHVSDDEEAYCYIQSKIIVLPRKTFLNPEAWEIFAFLHEIGHIMTNTNKMKRCTQEYLATQWAISESKKMGFKVPKSFIKTYQNYIWKWRETSIKHRGKNVPTREELTLAI